MRFKHIIYYACGVYCILKGALKYPKIILQKNIISEEYLNRNELCSKNISYENVTHKNIYSKIYN